MNLGVEDLDRLAEIASHDAALLERRLVIEAMPPRRAEIEGKLEELRARERQAVERVEEAESRLRDLWGKIEDLKQTVLEMKRKLDQVESNEAYRAGLSQITTTEETKDVTETEALETMEEIESLRGFRERVVEETGVVRAGLEAELQKVEEEEGRARDWVERHARDRDRLLEDLHPPLRRLYERVMRRHGDVAVVFLHDGICGGCQSRLPPQLGLEVRKRARLITCESCGRLLIPEDAGQSGGGIGDSGDAGAPAAGGGDGA
jgi:predicted  nucleic acid-binding Zn-ribbon protein